MLTAVEKAMEKRSVPNMDRILGNIDQARKGLAWCIENGLSAYTVDVEGSRPKILVETSAKLVRFVEDGLAAEIGSQHEGGIHSRVMCMVAHGCQIMWVERGH